jgi:hypothetical protein
MIIETAQLALEEAGYIVMRRPGDHGAFTFEDSAVLGLLKTCPSADFIFSEWQRVQDEFLREFAGPLRRVPLKAWNTYLVLLTPEPPTVQLRRRLAVIEEDFAGMRKIAVAEVLSSSDVTRALAPLLPVTPVALDDESFAARLRKAVPLDDAGFDALLNCDVERLVVSFLEEET